MRTRKIHTKKKAKNGEGRQANIKHLPLPEEVINELRLYKDAYSACLSNAKDDEGNPIPKRVTWEQMLRRWMDHVGRIDKDVKEHVERTKKRREEILLQPPILTMEKQAPEKKCVFVRDGEELTAIPGNLSPFYAEINGQRVGMKRLLADKWVLKDETGTVIESIDEAWKINKAVMDHLATDAQDNNQ